MRNAGAALVLTALLLAVAAGPAAAQCAMCKTALAGSPEGRGIGAQFNQAILVMLAAPYLVMGGFVLAVYRGRLRGDARRLGARIRARLRPAGR
jgi:hypothetical protein